VAGEVGVTVPVGPGVPDSSGGAVGVGVGVEVVVRVGAGVPPVVSVGVGVVSIASVVPVVRVGVVPGSLAVVEGSTDDVPGSTVTIVVVAGGV